MKLIYTFLCIPLLIVTTYSVKLPSYIKRCSVSDPNVSNCILENGNDAIRHITKGEKSLGIPKLKPLIIPQINIETNLLKMKANDVLIKGMDTAKIETTYINFKDKFANGTLQFKYINISSDFEIDAQFLVFNFDGKGPVKLDLVRPSIFCNITWKLEQREGNEYMVFDMINCDSDMKRIYFDLYRFFQDNEVLGETTTVNLNASWKVVYSELGPILMESIITVFKDVLNNVTKSVTYKDIFLP